MLSVRSANILHTSDKGQLVKVGRLISGSRRGIRVGKHDSLTKEASRVTQNTSDSLGVMPAERWLNISTSRMLNACKV